MTELTREQVEQYIEQLENWTAFLPQPIRQHLSALRDHNATLRAKLEAVERDNTKWQEIASMRISGDSKWLKEHELLKQQLAAVTQERDKFKADFNAVAQRAAQQRRVLAGKNEQWACTKLGLLREIERWRAKATGEVPTFGHGAKRDE